MSARGNARLLCDCLVGSKRSLTKYFTSLLVYVHLENTRLLFPFTFVEIINILFVCLIANDKLSSGLQIITEIIWISKNCTKLCIFFFYILKTINIHYD